MTLLKKTRIKLLCPVLVLCISINSIAQIVPYYPVEIFLTPCGYTNSLPGNDPDLYSTFSSLKVALNKDLPTMDRFSNTLSLVANIIKYHNITKSRDYHPFALYPTLTTHFFATDIFTIGLDLIGNMEYLPGIDTTRTTFNYRNYRFRIRPFHYVIMHPNVILQQLFTYGRSYNSDKSGRLNSLDQIEMVSNDYSVLRYELKAIYLSKFHTRIFLIPYYFQNQYYDIAIDAKKKIDMNLPKLNEEGFGCTIGMRYMTFTWGFAEGSFEYERNFDLTYGGNSYTKLKFNTRWENQYFTERFGYLFMLDLIKHISEGAPTNFKESTDGVQEVGQLEFRVDVMPMFNINRNVSIRPEFDMVYRNYTDRPNTIKNRYWLHIHVLF